MSENGKQAGAAIMSATDLCDTIRTVRGAISNMGSALQSKALNRLLAHLDALTLRAPVDGEALCLRVFMEQQGFTPEEAAESWAALSPAGRAENVRIGTALHAIGYAAGRSEGEAERARLASELATIRRLHELATGNREAARAEACAVIDRLGGEVAKRDAEIARLTVERDAAEQLTAAAVETGAADRERALNAEQERDAALAELAEARGSAKRWASLAERNGEDAMAHAARAKGLTTELAEATTRREEAEALVAGMSAALATARLAGARVEREECARIADAASRYNANRPANTQPSAAYKIADAIRARATEGRQGS